MGELEFERFMFGFNVVRVKMQDLNKTMWIDCHVLQIRKTNFVCIHGQSRTPVPTNFLNIRAPTELYFKAKMYAYYTDRRSKRRL